MANTTLPTGLTTGSTTHIPDHNTLHGEMNELSRSTGLRDVTSLLVNGWVVTGSGGVRIERVRDLVHFYWRSLNGEQATSAAFLNFGSGSANISDRFAPMDGSFQSDPVWDDSSTSYILRATATNLQTPSRRALGGYWRMVTWRAGNSAWPSTLPGTAV